MSKVVHLRDDAHSKAKDYCRVHSLKMSDWVAGLIERAMEGAPIAWTTTAATAVSVPAAAAAAAAAAAPAPAPAPAAAVAAAVTAPPAGRAIGQVEPVMARKVEEAPGTFVPKKKVLQKIGDTDEAGDSAVPPYAQPPFWSSTVNK